MYPQNGCYAISNGHGTSTYVGDFKKLIIISIFEELKIIASV